MADMTAIVALQQAERLVSTVARAFYTDISVLVVDMLVREKYIKDKDEDLGSRLNLKPTQTRAALQDLQKEGLVAQEEMTDEIYGNRKSAYWYIDLRQAVAVIRLRVHEMQTILQKQQQAKVAKQTYRCPRCDEKYGVMEIHRLSNGDRSFCCSHCCPNDDHRECKKSDYTLVDFHDQRGLDSVTTLLVLLNDQMGKSTDTSVSRYSIFELANALRDTVVPSNLPSQLRQRGMGGQQRGDLSSAHARFQDNFHYQGRAAEKAATERGTASGRNNSSKPVQLLYTKNWRGQEVVVEIEQSDEEDEDWAEEFNDDFDDGEGMDLGGDGMSGVLPSRASIKKKAAAALAKEQQAAKRAKKALPTFLKGSRISGTDGTDGNGNASPGLSEEESDEDDTSSTSPSVGGAGAAARARRLGAAAVNSVEELDEFKRRLLRETERMKQVWRRQQLERRAEAALEKWWENEDDDSEAPPGSVGQNGTIGGGGWVSNGGGIGAGVRRANGGMAVTSFGGVKVDVGGRKVPVDALTREDASKMSPEEYTKFYNLAILQL